MGIFKKSRIYGFLIVILLSTSVAIAGGVKDAVDQAKNQAIQSAFSYGDSAIESWARDNLSSLRLIEIETRSRADSKPTFRAITLFELSGNQFDKILSQISYSTFNDRETLNTGLVYRSMNQSMTHIYGINIFYDHEFNTGHARTGLGFEMKSSVYDVNINFYEAQTEIHHVEGVPEVAAGGYDAEIGAQIPYLPWAKVYYKGHEMGYANLGGLYYENDDAENKKKPPIYIYKLPINRPRSRYVRYTCYDLCLTRNRQEYVFTKT